MIIFYANRLCQTFCLNDIKFRQISKAFHFLLHFKTIAPNSHSIVDDKINDKKIVNEVHSFDTFLDSGSNSQIINSRY